MPEGASPNWVLGNHDVSRIATRLGPDQARMAAMLLLTLRGNATIYYGDEIGMTDVAVSRMQVHDRLEENLPGMGCDPERAPMQWDATANSGFSLAEPWLPAAAATFGEVNVAAEERDPTSMLTLYRRLIAYRRCEPALVWGTWALIGAKEDVLAYERRACDSRIGVVLNFGASTEAILPASGGEVLLSTYLDREGERTGGRLRLRADEGLIVRIDGQSSRPGSEPRISL